MWYTLNIWWAENITYIWDETDTLSRNLLCITKCEIYDGSHNKNIFAEEEHFESWCWRLNIVGIEYVWTGGQIRDAKSVFLEVKSEVGKSVLKVRSFWALRTIERHSKWRVGVVGRLLHLSPPPRSSPTMSSNSPWLVTQRLDYNYLPNILIFF